MRLQTEPGWVSTYLRFLFKFLTLKYNESLTNYSKLLVMISLDLILEQSWMGQRTCI